MLRGRVKFDFGGNNYGWLEVPGGPDHFIHVRMRRSIVVDVNGIGFTEITPEDGRMPKGGEWIIFKSGQLQGKSQPQAMPWAYADELEISFRRISTVFVECLRLLGMMA